MCKNTLEKEYNTKEIIEIYINLLNLTSNLGLAIANNRVSIKEALEKSNDILKIMKRYIISI